MAVTSNATYTVTLTGDITLQDNFAHAQNANSPGQVEVIDLASGFNSITVPQVASTGVATGCLIIPPSANTTNITLKGVTGDTGIQLHDSNPTFLAIDPTQATIGLTAASAISAVRFIFT